MVELAKKVKERNITADEIAALVAFTKQHGGIEYADRRMWEFHAEARKFIEEKVWNSEIKQALQAYLDFVIERKS